MPEITPGITTEWQSFDRFSADALYAMLRFRQQIFVVEQSSPFPDLDGLDQSARHLLLRADGALAGYLRLIPSAGEARIGRVAVAPPLRGMGLGRRLMEEALILLPRALSGAPGGADCPALPDALLRGLRLCRGVGALRRFRPYPHRHADAAAVTTLTRAELSTAREKLQLFSCHSGDTCKAVRYP